MHHDQRLVLIGRSVGLFISAYGLLLIGGIFLRTGLFHPLHVINAFFSSVLPLIGVSYLYLGSLLMRRKQNAWRAAVVVSTLVLALNAFQLLRFSGDDIVGAPLRLWLRVILPLFVFVLLLLSKRVFIVKSDVRSFQQALTVSAVLILVTLLYGTAGFMLLNKADLDREHTIITAAHETVDQFGLTTDRPVAQSKRARVFLDSLPVISVGTLIYVALSFFQPLRARLSPQASQREHVEHLLREYPSDIDDFFKLWPHDKRYYFSKDGTAGLAYHVSRGVALVVGDPFGNPKQISRVIASFSELCFVNDWMPAFLHGTDRFRKHYERHGLELQKIGEEAIVDLANFKNTASSKYFRQIANRFAKQGYTAEYLRPPHSPAVLSRLQEISDEWLQRPGREERRLMMGYFTQQYMQQCDIQVAKDSNGQIQGFLNLVTTYEPDTYNYDMLRSSEAALGNCNDFLLQTLIGELRQRNGKLLNLGLSPLAGLDKKAENANLIDSGLRFIYANGDRLYSFSGLQRFKNKYEPNWEPRYIVFPGGIRNFSRIVTAFNRVSKVK